MKIKTLIFSLGILLLTACSANPGAISNPPVPQDNRPVTANHPSNFVQVKYRDTPIDLADYRFEPLDTSKSSWIDGAWYDTGNQYMIINLNGTYYHYCGVPVVTWTNFKGADSFGTAYNKIFKGNYDCRIGKVPVY